MQEIVFQVFTDGDIEASEKTPLYLRYSFLEMKLEEKSELDKALEKPSPRLLKTHLQPKFFEKTLKNKKPKVIVVFRNPKDMLVSYFNFHRSAPFDFPTDGTWEELFDRFKNDKLVHGNYFDMQLAWWEYKDDPRFFFTTYEDMTKDPVKTICDVAKFLEKAISDELVMKIVERTSFSSMKNNPMLNYSTLDRIDQNISAFMRKGKIGDWKNVFSKEQQEYVDKISKEKFEPAGIFLEDE